MACMVTQRTNEIGLRMALGARPGDVLGMVVGQSMRLAGTGIALGIVCGLAVTRLMGNLLFDVPTYDPVTFGSVSLLVAAVAFVAGWLPARRWRCARISRAGRRNRLPHHCKQVPRLGGAGDFACESRFSPAVALTGVEHAQ
jgi:ABC-type lipoprotein release transport system permease subunit